MTPSEKLAFLKSFFAAAKYPANAELFSKLLGEEIKSEEIHSDILRNPEDEKWRQKYLKKAKFWLPLLRFVPGVRGAAVCNSLTFGGGGKKSDIDLFLITAPNRLWTARLLTTIFFQICGVRRHGQKIEGRLCLSFFIDETAMDFEKIALKPFDPYLALWIAFLHPVFGREVFAEFAECNRDFVRKNAPIRILFEKNLENIPEKKSKKSFRLDWNHEKQTLEKKKNSPDILEKIGDVIESFFKGIFFPRTQKKARNLADTSGTILTDHILKFHNADKRAFFAEKTCRPTKNAAQ